MEVLSKQIAICSLAFLLACHIGTDKQKAKLLNRYKDTPAFIQSFLNSKHNGNFLIAEPGEEWNSGCVGTAGVPRLQLRHAFFDSTEYCMEFFGGGIVGPHLDTMILGLNNNRVISYSIGRYSYKVK